MDLFWSCFDAAVDGQLGRRAKRMATRAMLGVIVVAAFWAQPLSWVVASLAAWKTRELTKMVQPLLDTFHARHLPAH